MAKKLLTSNLINELRKLIKQHGLYGYVIPNNDEFQNEYLPDSAKRLEFLTGFTGSAGTAIITLDEQIFFTDGRYTLQAGKELGKSYQIKNVSHETIFDWISKKGKKIGFDPWLFTVSQVERLGNYGIAVKDNLIDQLWNDKPPAPNSKAVKHAQAGRSHLEKIKQVSAQLKKNYAFISTPDSVNWLFNIRGSDIAHTPLLLSYAVLAKSGEAYLIADPKRVGFELAGVKVKPLSELLKFKSKDIQLDPARTPFAIYEALLKGKNKITFAKDPCQYAKAIKNPTEIKGIKKAHEIDGKALTKFIKWVKKQDPNTLDEIKSAEKLAEFREANSEYKGPSFTTISGFGSNGAIVHYSVSRETNKKFKAGSLYLVDSGGQYEFGTTDVTRTIAIGKPTKEMINDYTLVLKGHIALARAKFPKGINGAQLDALARQFLWAEAKDYDHGTGHGVGYYLSVHEGPQGISRRASEVALETGMVISNEPGYYKEGAYGIRIENLVLVVDAGNGYLGFETLTKAPLDEDLIEWKILTQEETSWVKGYQKSVVS